VNNQPSDLSIDELYDELARAFMRAALERLISGCRTPSRPDSTDPDKEAA